jgi:hypothetical protein
MILCESDAPEGDPGQSCVHLFARSLSPLFQFSLSAVTLVYLSQWLLMLCPTHTHIIDVFGRLGVVRI